MSIAGEVLPPTTEELTERMVAVGLEWRAPAWTAASQLLAVAWKLHRAGMYASAEANLRAMELLIEQAAELNVRRGVAAP